MDHGTVQEQKQRSTASRHGIKSESESTTDNSLITGTCLLITRTVLITLLLQQIHSLTPRAALCWRLNHSASFYITYSEPLTIAYRQLI
jgi:hypothetical protein